MKILKLLQLTKAIIKKLYKNNVLRVYTFMWSPHNNNDVQSTTDISLNVLPVGKCYKQKWTTEQREAYNALIDKKTAFEAQADQAEIELESALTWEGKLLATNAFVAAKEEAAKAALQAKEIMYSVPLELIEHPFTAQQIIADVAMQSCYLSNVTSNLWVWSIKVTTEGLDNICRWHWSLAWLQAKVVMPIQETAFNKIHGIPVWELVPAFNAAPTISYLLASSTVMVLVLGGGYFLGAATGCGLIANIGTQALMAKACGASLLTQSSLGWAPWLITKSMGVASGLTVTALYRYNYQEPELLETDIVVTKGIALKKVKEDNIIDVEDL